MRLIQLDVFRGVACLMVLLFHYTTMYSNIFNDSATVQLVNFKYGGLGVDLFFIISGFVIFLTINKNNSPLQFLLKRFVRLYPTFWICVLITFFLVHLSDLNLYKRSISDLLVNLTMMPDVFGVPRVDGVYWSLLPELVFYLMCYLAILLKQLKSINVICAIWLLLILSNHFIDYPPLRVLLNLRFGHLFIIGIYFYKLMHEKNKWMNHLFILMSLLVAFFINTSVSKSLFLIVFITFFYLLVYKKLDWLKFAPLAKLGEISYALYLTHQFIGYIIIAFLIKSNITNPFMLICIPLSLSILISALITFYLEKPLRNFTNRHITKIQAVKFSK